MDLTRSPKRSPARKVSIKVYVDTGCLVRTRSGPSASERSGLTSIGFGFDAPPLVNRAGRRDRYVNVEDYQALVDYRVGIMAGNCVQLFFADPRRYPDRCCRCVCRRGLGSNAEAEAERNDQQGCDQTSDKTCPFWSLNGSFSSSAKR